MALNRKIFMIIGFFVVLLLIFGSSNSSSFREYSYPDELRNPFTGLSSKLSSFYSSGKQPTAAVVGYLKSGCGTLAPDADQKNGKNIDIGESWTWSNVGTDPSECHMYQFEGNIQHIASMSFSRTGCLVRIYSHSQCNDEDGVELFETTKDLCFPVAGKNKLTEAEVPYTVVSSHELGDGPRSFNIDCSPASTSEKIVAYNKAAGAENDDELDDELELGREPYDSP